MLNDTRAWKGVGWEEGNLILRPCPLTGWNMLQPDIHTHSHGWLGWNGWPIAFYKIIWHISLGGERSWYLSHTAEDCFYGWRVKAFEEKRKVFLAWSYPSLKKKYIYIYLFLERRGGREKERERNMYQLPFILGTEPVTQACALTGNRTCDFLLCGMMPNQLSPTDQGWSYPFGSSKVLVPTL